MIDARSCELSHDQPNECAGGHDSLNKLVVLASETPHQIESLELDREDCRCAVHLDKEWMHDSKCTTGETHRQTDSVKRGRL